MRTPRARRIGRQEADELLRGITTTADREDLLRLLALAAAPPRPEELVGREDALAAFRNGASRPATVPSRRRRIWTLVSRALMVKVLAGAGVLAIGGAAVAAGTGTLPPDVQRGAHNLLSPLGVQLPDGHRSSAPPRGTGTPSPSTSPTAQPAPAVAPSGLCDAWRKEKDDKGKPMDPAARQALANAAGGPQYIADYCGRVLGSGSTPAPAPTPQPDGGPDGSPKAHPDPHPSKPDKSKDHPVPTHSPKQH